jgi:hypothetical protein
MRRSLDSQQKFLAEASEAPVNLNAIQMMTKQT